MSINLAAEQVKELENQLKVAVKNTPQYIQIEKQLSELKLVLEKKNKIIKKAGKKGYRPNPNDGSCCETGEKVKANCGFAKNTNYGWQIFSWSVVEAEVG